MPDFIIEDRLTLIGEHVDVILERIKKISSADDFTDTDDGQILFDSILTRLQSIGENIKKIESIQKGFTQRHLHLDPGPIIRFRDIASHHYELMDYQVVYDICIKHIPELATALARQRKA
jgi:uncharacterized protein with HEPN domain